MYGPTKGDLIFLALLVAVAAIGAWELISWLARHISFSWS
jgi:hypothetical protein